MTKSTILNGQETFSHVHHWILSHHKHYVLLEEKEAKRQEMILFCSLFKFLHHFSVCYKTLEVGKRNAATARDVHLICATLIIFRNSQSCSL